MSNPNQLKHNNLRARRTIDLCFSGYLPRIGTFSTAAPNGPRDRDREEVIFEHEKKLDVMQKEIVEFLGDLLTGAVAHDVVDEARKQLRMADEYESVSDYIVTILKLRLKRLNAGLLLTDEDRRDLLLLHDQTADYLDMINQEVKEVNSRSVGTPVMELEHGP